MSKTHYEILELAAGAEPEEIRKAYRRLAARLHPDLLPDQLKEAATAEFVKIQLAYEELSEPGRRGAYDKYLAKEAKRREEAAASAAQPKPKPQPTKAQPKPPPEPQPQPAGEPTIALWYIWATFVVFLALAVGGYWIAGAQYANSETGWGKIYPVCWMAITLYLICLACFEDGVLYSMFLTIGAIGLLAALLQGVSWTMLGVQLGFTLVIVGVVKMMFMLILDRRDELAAQLKPDRNCA